MNRFSSSFSHTTSGYRELNERMQEIYWAYLAELFLWSCEERWDWDINQIMI